MRTRSIAPFLVLLVAAVGCSSLRESVPKTGQSNSVSNSVAPGDRPSNTAGTFTPSGDPKSDIERISRKFVEQTSFRATMTGTGQAQMNMELDYIAPDRFHMKNGTVSEIIVIGKDTYQRSGETWRKIPVDMSKTIPNLRDTFTEEGMKLISDIKKEGDDSVDGEPSISYSYKGKSPADQSVHNARLWVAKSTGLPLKIEATYPSGMLEKAVIKYEYPTNLVIEPPVKN